MATLIIVRAGDQCVRKAASFVVKFADSSAIAGVGSIEWRSLVEPEPQMHVCAFPRRLD